MKKEYPDLNQFRVKSGHLASPDTHGTMGAFIIPSPTHSKINFCVVSSGPAREGSELTEWEHVSVSCRDAKRPPNWEEMCFIKDLFFDYEETVIQFHPAKSEYVNNKNNCLHLWKNISGHELPPSILTGIKRLREVSHADIDAFHEAVNGAIGMKILSREWGNEN